LKNLVKVLLAFVLVLSITLPFANSSAEAATKVSYLMNKKKEYTYYFPLADALEDSKDTFKFVKKSGNFDVWSGRYNFGYKETKKGLYLEDHREDLTYLQLAYPIKKNKKWKSVGLTYQIVEINKKVKVKAGTFKNVVVVKEYMETLPQAGYAEKYYAPNVGLILTKVSNEYTNFKAKKSQELIKLKNK